MTKTISAYTFKRRWVFPLRYKLLILASGLLVVSVSIHIWLATKVMIEDKEVLIFDLNKSQVSNVRNELSSRLTTASHLIYNYIFQNENASSNVAESGDTDLVLVATRGLTGELIKKYSVFDSQKNSDKTKQYLEAMTEKLKEAPAMVTPFRILSLAVGSDKYLLLERAVVVEDENGRVRRHSKAYAVMSLEEISRSLASNQNTKMAILSSAGDILVSSAEPEAFTGLIEQSQKMISETQVFKFTNNGTGFLGAASKSDAYTVLAQTNQSVLNEPLFQLLRRSLLFGGVVISLAFLIILVFSKSVTRPLESLMESMNNVSAGDLNQNVTLKSNDEISKLSESFNQMVKDLRVSRDKLEEINKELENKVKDRTKQLEEQNRAVKEAQEALLRTTRLAAVGEIAGRAAHEVLNPLTGILARLEKIKSRVNEGLVNESQILKEIQSAWKKDYSSGGLEGLIKTLKAPSQLKPEQIMLQEDLENLQSISDRLDEEVKFLKDDTKFLLSESQRISRIISQMRSLSHTQSKRVTVPVHDWIKESHNVMADLLEKENVNVKYEFNAKTDMASINTDEFLQVMTNLIRNAVQAMSGCSQKTLTLSTSTTGDREITIDIADTGHGIDESNKSRLFVKQFSTKDATEGTGLGLSICRRFVRSFDGDLILKSTELNKGSVFQISLPLVSETKSNEHTRAGA